MDNVLILPAETMENHFIEPEFLPLGMDENYLRNTQEHTPKKDWRHLHSDEVKQLLENDNSAQNWDNILVVDPFEPKMIKNSRFYGLVRIGAMRNVILEHHDLRLPAGITNSLIVSSDIGDDVAIHDVHYLAHYFIGNNSILFNIKEMIYDGPRQVRQWNRQGR